jgi:hypothetical protein
MSSLPTSAEDVIDQPARDQFEVFLDEHRGELNGCLDGLTEEQARRSLVLGTASLVPERLEDRGRGGLIARSVCTKKPTGLGIAATRAANVAHGLGYDPIGAAVAAWPAVALVGSYELLMMIIRGPSSLRATCPPEWGRHRQAHWTRYGPRPPRNSPTT